MKMFVTILALAVYGVYAKPQTSSQGMPSGPPPDGFPAGPPPDGFPPGPPPDGFPPGPPPDGFPLGPPPSTTQSSSFVMSKSKFGRNGRLGFVAPHQHTAACNGGSSTTIAPTTVAG